MNDSEKMEAFGRMVFSMVTDVLVLPSSDEAYARRTITTPDGRGGKHSLELIIARRGVADMMERAVSQGMAVKDATGTSGRAQ